MPQPFIDFAHIKEHASFEPVLAHYNLKLSGRGAGRAVLCPFHDDRRPSCKIELERKIFHCFGCQAKGNVLDFVAKKENTDLRSAAATLARICKIPLAPSRSSPTRAAERPKEAPAQELQSERKPKAPAPEAPAEPVNPPLTFTLKLDPAHSALSERGLTPETIALFGLGYCSRGLMKGRICFPIHNPDGELIAYAGRWVDQGDPPEGEDKYKLPAKFLKNQVLYNLHRVPDTTHVVAVEGFWSTIRLHTLGIPVIGLMGSSVSSEQIALLVERGTRSLVLLMDGDDAGYQARERLLPVLCQSFFVAAPRLPEGMKPDTLDEADLVLLVEPP